MLDKDRIIAEIAARNGIRIEEKDPIFAVVTATQVGPGGSRSGASK